MKYLIRSLLALPLSLTSLLLTSAHAQQVNCAIEIPLADSGYFDVHGDRDTRESSGLAGITSQWEERSPFRSFLVFSIPALPGTLVGATLVSDAYSISPQGSETIDFRSVETPVSALRKGGFGLTNIHADLGDGTFYGSASFPSGFWYNEQIPLNASAVTRIAAAQGQDFALAGALASISAIPNSNYNEYIVLPFSNPSQTRLRLDLSVPVKPSIYRQPAASGVFTNEVIATVGACGAEPLSYHWWVNGANVAVRSTPDVLVPASTPGGAPVFVIVSNSFGSVTSAVTQVQRSPSSIRWPYTNLTIRVGQSLQVIPTIFVFTGPTTITWFKNDQVISNASGASIYFYSVQTNDSGDYRIVVSNSLGVVTSEVLHLTVVETPPVFWEQPIDRTVPYGNNVYWSAYAVAGPPPIYRWFHNSAVIADQTGPTLALFAVTQSDAGSYYAIASNHLGAVTSIVATLSVFVEPPRFFQHPQSRTAYPGSQVAFNVSAAGSPYPTLQWYFNGEPIFGAGSSQLFIANVSSNHAGTYFCIASNLSGLATSAVATLTVPYLPPLLTGPDDLTLLAGSTAVFSITVSNPPVQVDWRFNGSNIPGNYFGDPSTHYLFLYNVDTNNAGLYWAVVSNSVGVTTSRVASLVVTTAAPAFVSQPVDQSVLEGATIDIFFNASGGPAPQFFLFRNGVDTGARPEFPRFRFEVALADAGNYQIVASNRVGVAVSRLFRIDVQRAGPLDRWTRRNPVPQGDDLFAITYGQGQFVAVGRNGAIINSTDGTNWNVRTFRTTAELQAVASGNGRFVAVGDEGLVLTSTNANDWTRVYVPGVFRFDALTYGDGRFVAVARLTTYAERAGVFVSSNGTDWVDASTTAPATYFLRGIAYGNGAFIAVDYNRSFRSTDLITWTLTATNVTLYGPESIRFLANRFLVAGDNGEIYTSSDGVAWSSQNSGNSFRFYDSAYGDDTFVAVGARGMISRSADAVTWLPVVSPTENRLEAITFANGLFVAVGERGMILTSTDAENWTVQLRGSSRDLDGMAAGNGLLMTVGKNNVILTSHDGRDWTRRTPPILNTNTPVDWHGVGFGNGRWVVVGDSTNILTSTNAIDWEVRFYSAPYTYLKHVTYAAGLWIAVGVGGVILTSPDAVEWTQQISPVPYDLNEVAYGDGSFVIVGDSPNRNGTLLVSTNGTIWMNRSFNAGKNMRAVTFANGLFVAALNDGVILYANDPYIVPWQPATTGVTGDGQNLRGLTYGDGLWVCVGNNGRIITSTNAALWKTRITRTDQNLHAVRYINGTFVAVGNEGVIVQCAPLVSSLAAARDGDTLQLTFSSPWEQIFTLQHTSDFNWQNLATLTNAFGTIDYRLPLPAGAGFKFYRVVSP